MKSTTIRFAEKKDLPEIVELCRLHALYEKSDYDIKGKEEALAKYIFDESPALYCMVAEHEGKLIGYVTYMKQFSTWDACHYMYLDCLFMRESARGFGIGEQLMNHVKAAAAESDCQLIQWQTPDFNTRAIKFYKRIGAISKSKERFFWEV